MKTKILLFLIFILAFILRLSWLDKLPLYTDETNQGYNAYSISKTGRDEHGVFLPVSLRSFGDWKPAVPTYLMIPFIWIIGLNEYSARLPSVILGLGTIVLTYYLVKVLFRKRNLMESFQSRHSGLSRIDSGVASLPRMTNIRLLNNFPLSLSKLALISALFLSISPWHLLQSRSAMLVIVSLFFIEAGVLFFIKSFNNPKLMILSAASFVLSVYSYYGMRIVSPLIILFMAYYYRKNIRFFSKPVLLAGILSALLLMPLGINFTRENDVIFGRARTVSIFYDQGVKLRQWELISQDGINFNPLVSRFFHNNVYMFGRKIAQGFLSHFDPNYLLQTGDRSPPFSIPGAGIIYAVDSAVIILGLIISWKNRFSGRILLITWLLISIIPASLTFMVPASNRTFNAVIPLLIFASIGLTVTGSRIKYRKLFITAVTVIYAVGISFVYRQYFQELPLKHSGIWNGGMRETISKVAELENKYDNIVFSDVNGMPYIYLLFYNRMDPEYYQQNAVRTYIADRFGFEHVESLGKYIFDSELNWQNLKDNLQAKTLYVIPADQKPDKNYIDLISFPDGLPAYYLISNEQI